jgi:hypothetical protein
VLTHKKARQLLVYFLKSEYADESIEFYDAVATYKQCADAAEREKQAKRLVEQYVPDGAPRQINVPSHTQQRVLKAHKEGSIGLDTFDECRQEVYQLMSKDSLARFVQTKEFGNLLAAFGSYDLAAAGVNSDMLDLELMAA